MCTLTEWVSAPCSLLFYVFFNRCIFYVQYLSLFSQINQFPFQTIKITNFLCILNKTTFTHPSTTWIWSIWIVSKWIVLHAHALTRSLFVLSRLVSFCSVCPDVRPTNRPTIIIINIHKNQTIQMVNIHSDQRQQPRKDLNASTTSGPGGAPGTPLDRAAIQRRRLRAPVWARSLSWYIYIHIYIFLIPTKSKRFGLKISNFYLHIFISLYLYSTLWFPEKHS